MNTPDPCNTCKFCKYDPMFKDDPEAEAWCDLKMNHWGNMNCPMYEHYQKKTEDVPQKL